jgi:hypothetical protein
MFACVPVRLGWFCTNVHTCRVPYLYLELDTGAFLHHYGYIFQLACFLMFCSQDVGIFSNASLLMPGRLLGTVSAGFKMTYLAMNFAWLYIGITFVEFTLGILKCLFRVLSVHEY